MHNDALARVRATYCTKHKSLPGVPCFEAPAAYSASTFGGYCGDRIAVVTVEAIARDEARKDREHRKARHRNRAA